MTAATHRFVIPHCETARPDIAAFADGLSPDSEFYWPALAAADGCDASLAELNAMMSRMIAARLTLRLMRVRLLGWCGHE